MRTHSKTTSPLHSFCAPGVSVASLCDFVYFDVPLSSPPPVALLETATKAGNESTANRDLILPLALADISTQLDFPFPSPSHLPTSNDCTHTHTHTGGRGRDGEDVFTAQNEDMKTNVEYGGKAGGPAPFPLLLPPSPPLLRTRFSHLAELHGGSLTWAAVPPSVPF